MSPANAGPPETFGLQHAKWLKPVSRCCRHIRLTLKIVHDTSPNSGDSPRESKQIRQNEIPSRRRHFPCIFGMPPFEREPPAGYPKKAPPDIEKGNWN